MVKVTLMKKCNGFCVMGVVLDTKEKIRRFYVRLKSEGWCLKHLREYICTLKGVFENKVEFVSVNFFEKSFNHYSHVN